jgi:hypothetical protein
MKTINHGHCFPIVLCAIATALLLSSQADAKPPLYNYEFPIAGPEQATGLRPGAKIAMACTNCKTVQVRDVDKKRAFLDWFTPGVKHACPGCGGYYQYSERRFGFRGAYVHVCSKCGDKSMFCCATQPGKKTKGM